MNFWESVNVPTLVLNKDRAIQNIRRMADKALKSGVRFRPHFKTHQSAEVGEWFRDAGVDSITVSSLNMADYFAKHGWNNITVAFPVNIREMDKINQLANRIRLGLLVESNEAVRFLADNLKCPVKLWIKIDTGYKRTGMPCNRFEEIDQLVKEINRAPCLRLEGVLTHSGHSYQATSEQEIRGIYTDTVSKMKQVREQLVSMGTEHAEISIGDTPCCSVVGDFSAVDEIRPGNFVFYDVMQLRIGSCAENDIAVAVACPVVAKHSERNEIVIYGGAVHLSKDSIEEEGRRIFGRICMLQDDGWSSVIPDCYVASLSQEHGIAKVNDELFRKTKIGDLLMVLPVHSCLTVDLMREYLTVEGERICAIQNDNQNKINIG